MWYIVYKYVCVCVHIPRGFPVALVVKNPPAHARDIRDTGSIPGLGRFPWRWPWQSTPVFLPGESHGWVLRPAEQVGIKMVDAQFGEKELETELKFKDGTRDSRPLGSRALFLEPHHSYLVSWQEESICCATMKSVSCVPSHISCFIDYFKLSLLFFCTRAIT